VGKTDILTTGNDACAQIAPKDEFGNYHIDMMRLEVEAGKT
jgi:hypothetical protein